MSRWSVAVVIPAHDEEASIAACIHAVRRALARIRAELHDASIVVVADRCGDATVAQARRALRGAGEVVEADAGNAGRARAIGASAAIGRHRRPFDRLWLANTDADTVVPSSWLEHQLRLASFGVAAVAGIVAVDSFAEHPLVVPGMWAAHYDGPAHLPHPHVHGANLGVRADAYLAAGGWTSRVTGEDQALWQALHATGCRRASPRSLVVTTSGRARSRTPGGFAGHLRLLGQAS